MLILNRLAGECDGLYIRLLDINTQFFFQLANQRGLRSFTSFNLPTGELPKTSHRLAFRSLLHQNSAALIDQRSGSDK